MRPETFDETLKAFANRRPYRPFTISLVNGNRFEVDHPGAILIRDGVAVYLAPGGIPVIFDYEGISEVVGDLKGNGEA
jgi:hypothetical protein